jgi:hypothetical protein
VKTKLGSDASSRVERGMLEGAQLIKRKLELMYNPHGWTVGIMDRYLIICQAR